MPENYSRPLDVHRWSDHPESNKFVNQIYGEWFAEDTPDITKKHLKVILLDIYVGWKTHPDTTIGITFSPLAGLSILFPLRHYDAFRLF